VRRYKHPKLTGGKAPADVAAVRCLAYGLDEAAAQIDMTKWPAPAIRLYVGQMTPEAVLVAFN
jgi:hypothetical protein